jgi:hypothetical protein
MRPEPGEVWELEWDVSEDVDVLLVLPRGCALGSAGPDRGVAFLAVCGCGHGLPNPGGVGVAPERWFTSPGSAGCKARRLA